MVMQSIVLRLDGTPVKILTGQMEELQLQIYQHHAIQIQEITHVL
jgi:hypothetical protein